MVFPAQTTPSESKTGIHITWPHLDDQVEASHVVATQGILSFKVLYNKMWPVKMAGIADIFLRNTPFTASSEL